MVDERVRVAEYEVGDARRITLDVVIGDAAAGSVTVSLDRDSKYSGRGRKGIRLGSGAQLRGKVLQVVGVVSKVVPRAIRVSLTAELKGGLEPLRLHLASPVDSGDDVELLARVMFV